MNTTPGIGSTNAGSSAYMLAPPPITGKLPKARLTSASQACQIFWNTHQANKARNAYGAYLQGIADGNPPYMQSTLRNSGQGWRANYSTKEAKARKDTAKTPYYDLFSAGPTYCEVVTKVDGDLDAESASGVMTVEFHKMLKAWPGFDLNFWKMLDDFVGYGRGWIYWSDMDSWCFKRVPWWRVRFPDGTDVDPEEWELFTIEHVFNPVNLNAYIRDEEAARAAGWNPAQVRKALTASVPLDPNSAEDAMLVQQMIQDQDIGLMYRASTIQAASVYVKEWDGSWSRMIVQTGKNTSADVALNNGDWLYYKNGVADEVSELMAGFMFEVESGSINGLGGLLRDIADQVMVKNRMSCERVNNGFLRSTVLMQANTASSRVKGGLLTVGGGVTLISEGMQIQQSSIIGDIQSLGQLNDEMGRELDINTGIFRPQQEKPSGNPEPLGTTQLRFAQSSVLTNSAVNRFQIQMDWMFKETYRRASQDLSKSSDKGIKAALAFQKRCMDRGVSREQLEKPDSVTAFRIIGNGSPGMRQQLTAELANFLPVLQLGQRGLRNFAKMIIAARGGQDTVDRLMPAADEADMPSEQDREALQENVAIKVGSQVLVIENDDHLVHLRRHFEAGFGALQAAQQGGDLAEAAAFIQGAQPHIGEHISKLMNPQQQKAAEQMAKQLEQGFGELTQAIEQQQQGQQQQQQALSDIQLKQAATQASIQDKQMKTQAGLQDKAMKTQQAMAINAMKTQQQMGIADATTAADILRQNAVTKADILSKREKAVANNGKKK